MGKGYNMLNFIRNIFKKYKYKRVVPEDMRKELHCLLDALIDDDNYYSSSRMQYNLLCTIKAVKHLYKVEKFPLTKEDKEDDNND